MLAIRLHNELNTDRIASIPVNLRVRGKGTQRRTSPKGGESPVVLFDSLASCLATPRTATTTIFVLIAVIKGKKTYSMEHQARHIDKQTSRTRSLIFTRRLPSCKNQHEAHLAALAQHSSGYRSMYLPNPINPEMTAHNLANRFSIPAKRPGYPIAAAPFAEWQPWSIR